MTEQSIASVTVPVSIVLGAKDDQSIPGQAEIPIGRNMQRAEVRVVPKAHHYAFLSEGTIRSKLIAPDLFRDPLGLNRTRLHNVVARQAGDFFKRHL
jgi:predicted dienelactone hydrolase